MLPFPGVLLGVSGSLRRKVASLLLREDAEGKPALRFPVVERARLLAHRVRTTMLRAPTASLLVAHPRGALSQPGGRSGTLGEIEGASDYSDPLPAFVVKAQENAHARRALVRMGRREVQAAFTRQLRG